MRSPVPAALFLLLLPCFTVTTAYAFHSGGVAECGGCHSMHSPATGGTFLLVGTDQSSACLSCHEHAGDTGPSSYHISTADADMPAGVAPLQRTPGGDFGWLKKDYSFTVRGTATSENGHTHGHNIVAADFDYPVDDNNATAPGGSFPSAQLACTSCHDPHGKYRRTSAATTTIVTAGAPIIGSGSYDTSPVPAPGQAVGVYRLLAGAGYTKGGITFPGAPMAVAPATYNRSEASTQTRVAYGHQRTNGVATWGDWCGACHPNMHSPGGSRPYRHPVDRPLGSGGIVNIYNQYRKSGDMTGTGVNSYTTLVPYSEATASFTVLRTHARNNDTFLQGPASSDRVICLSCHRAHASGFPEMLRWQMEGEFIVYDSQYPGTDTTPTVPQFSRGRTGAETQAAYYDRPVTVFATYQRVLCNKCHGQD
jgi:predicted CXXCH cytochrome family protein